VGVLYAIDVPSYDEHVVQQIDEAIGHHGTGSIKELLNSGNTWIVE
jgi:hypothetical protein